MLKSESNWRAHEVSSRHHEVMIYDSAFQHDMYLCFCHSSYFLSYLKGQNQIITHSTLCCCRRVSNQNLIVQQAVKNVKAQAAAVPQANNGKQNSSAQLTKLKDKSEEALLVHDDKHETSTALQKTRQATQLPSDFFDNHDSKRQKEGKNFKLKILLLFNVTPSVCLYTFIFCR